MSMKGDSADGKCNQLHSTQTSETIILHVTGTFTVHLTGVLWSTYTTSCLVHQKKSSG